MRIILPIFIGALTGVLSGFGLGGGTLLMLYMTTFGGLAQQMAGGVNLLYFLPCSAAAIVGHIKNRQIEGKAALFVILSGLPAGVLGALLAGFLDEQWLRRVFGLLLLAVGLREAAFRKKQDETAGE